MMMANVGQNDKYLITKLRSYNISIEKIDSYLGKLNSENSNTGLSGSMQIDMNMPHHFTSGNSNGSNVQD